ncbi:hypothetical protein ACFFX0_08250 [Citricoccus parietis]|uniref:Uncharacterized protein n=1 Tax=Citricoccus parietis TaxID=592307 RepID=A0ABV5FX26_9MICC
MDPGPPSLGPGRPRAPQRPRFPGQPRFESSFPPRTQSTHRSRRRACVRVRVRVRPRCRLCSEPQSRRLCSEPRRRFLYRCPRPCAGLCAGWWHRRRWSAGPHAGDP